MPNDGESVQALTGIGPPPSSSASAPGTGDGDISDWTIAPIPRDLGDPAETEWVNQRRSPQPIATFTEPVRLTKPIESWDFSRTYIKATADENEAPDSPFWQASARASASPLWSHHEVACNHMAPLLKPNEVTSILLDVAGQGG